MNAADVVHIYATLDDQHVDIWVDGGWCIDALVGSTVRGHSDLDIAVRRSDDARLREVLEGDGFRPVERDGSTAWSYVLGHADGRVVDVHVFEYDADGRNAYGVEYPFGSLTGQGTLAGRAVRCVAAEWMFAFKTAYDPQPKDIEDVRRLAAAFHFQLPARYRL